MSSCCLSHASLLLPNHERNNTHDCQHRYLWNSSLMCWSPRHTWLPEYYVQFFSSLEAKTQHMTASVFVWMLPHLFGRPFVLKTPASPYFSKAGSWLTLKAHVSVFYFVESGSSILRFVYAGACWVMRIAQYPKGLHSVKLCKIVNK
jgi:hypothetical protein